MTTHANPGPFGLEHRSGPTAHGADDRGVRGTREWWSQPASEPDRGLGARDGGHQSGGVSRDFRRTGDRRYAVDLALEY